MEDERIIELFFERSEDAITLTAQKYGAQMKRLALSITGCDEDAEECVNDAYYAAWNHIPPDRPKNFGAWLMKTLRNFSNKVWEKKNAEKRRGNTAELTKELEECIPDAGSVEDEVFARELSKKLDRFLGSLPSKERKVFMKRYFWSMPIADIAKEYGVPKSRIATMLFRTRKKFGKMLEEDSYEGN
ncbi:MAG: sigma-70 family RNA polymerase sigma factor [Clostridia bacterium]|nr:sigma-70 family RNA polymerase sigma factor [Clostridia bacterium]